MPNSVLSADTMFPSLEGKSTKQQIETITNYLYLLLENLRYTLSNLGTENFNEEELNGLKKVLSGDLEIIVKDLNGNMSTITQKVDSIEVKVEDVEGNVTKVTQTVNKLSSSVTNLQGEFSEVQQDVNGLQIRTSGGTTYITGDHVKSGSLEGSKLICNLNSTSGSTDGELLFKYFGNTVGRIQMDTFGNGDSSGDESKYRVFIESLGDFVLKLISDKDLSITSKTGNIYIGANAGRVNVNGQNSVWLRPYTGYTYKFEKDGIYLNDKKIVSA